MRAFLLSLCFCLLATLAVASDWSIVFKSTNESVVRLEVKAGDEQGTCSGSVINADKGYILTAGHCTLEKADYTADDKDATLVKKNTLLDLAILQTKWKKTNQLILAPNAPEAGAEIAAIGYAFGDDQLAIQEGIVANPLENDSKRMRLSADIIPGDSGGPIVDASGRIVGVTSAIVWSSITPASHLGVAVPWETVRDFVEPYLPGHEAKR